MSIYDVARELLQKWYDDRILGLQEIAGYAAEQKERNAIEAEFTRYSDLIDHLDGHAENS